MRYIPLNPTNSRRNRSPIGVRLELQTSSEFNLNLVFRLNPKIHLDSLENFMEHAEDLVWSMSSNALQTELCKKFKGVYPDTDHSRDYRFVGFAANTIVLQHMKTFQGCSLLKSKPLSPANKVRGRIGNYRLYEDSVLNCEEIIAIFKVKNRRIPDWEF
ncbi:hypothetical protein [Yersinia ruckeri]|uniref:hypothetical protein n=1 Tax=Yersinia ruckeri TaxID=29486 RepID=UPI0022382683|nr:hypothetical protein [Yersinia ruckeri]MCW6598648.1 hypothetical protein [Yersinia ruckeri]